MHHKYKGYRFRTCATCPAPSCPCSLHHFPNWDLFGVQLERMAGYIKANEAWLPQMVWIDVPPQAREGC